jgi:protein-L-isoaspartate(D-aspartate) O-methyltransferase
MDHQQAHFNMIEQQIRPWDVLDIRVLDALAQLPRHPFVPDAFQNIAYSDLPIPLDHQQSMLEPKVVGRFLQALNCQVDEHVLEVGTGSGYLTALLATLGAHVTSVELNPDLRDQAATKLNAQGIQNVHLLSGNAAYHWQDGKRYNAIVLTGAVAQRPQQHLESLELGGRLVAVIGQSPNMKATLFTRIEHQQWSEEVLFETDIPYLDSAHPAPSFHF